MNMFEKAIDEKAKRKFNEMFDEAIKVMKNNDILKRLFIGELRLVNQGGGYCPGTDLFISSSNDSLLKKETNIDKVREELTEKYREEEQTKILDDIKTLKEYMGNE